MQLGETTIHLGERKVFLERLDRALAAEGAVLIEIAREEVGGFPVTTWEVRLKDGVVYLEDDGLLGKSLSGPHRLVQRIARMAFGLDAMESDGC